MASDLEARLHGRHGIQLQVEHGLDERHALVHEPRPHLSQVESGQGHVLLYVCLQRELRAAPVARRGRARQVLAREQDAR